MIQVTDAEIYGTKGAIAYEVTYSDGTKVRAVQERDGWIRKEFKTAAGEWKLSGAPYKVEHSKKRAAERIKKTAQEFITA